MNKTNTLIVGQGIAGSLIAYLLHQYDIPFMVMDPLPGKTSSLVAAGMFSPVSGKRKTLSQLTLQQIPFSINLYQNIEKLLDKQLLHLDNVYQVFDSEEERNELVTKTEIEDYKAMIKIDPIVLQGVMQEHGAAEILNSGWLDCAGFVIGFRDWLEKKALFIRQQFDYQKLLFKENGFQYNNLQFERIIFCEGYRGMNNPFFINEIIIPCKGDVLTIKQEDFTTNHIIKKSGIYLVQLDNNTFKAGATYSWDNKIEEPDETSKLELESKLKRMLEKDFTIINHQSGIRPTTKNREVIAMQHHQYKNMFMFNGLGTKGVIQGPWFAHKIMKDILNK